MSGQKIVDLRPTIPLTTARPPGEGPWALEDVLERLADAADHLHHDHSCDTHGWETARAAATEARRMAKLLRESGSRLTIGGPLILTAASDTPTPMTYGGGVAVTTTIVNPIREPRPAHLITPCPSCGWHGNGVQDPLFTEHYTTTDRTMLCQQPAIQQLAIRLHTQNPTVGSGG